MISPTEPRVVFKGAASALETLVAAAYDQHLLLTAKLVFHLFAKPAEFKPLTAEDHSTFYVRVPIESRVGKLAPYRRSGMRPIPLADEGGQDLGVLLPSPGPFFTIRRPWRRLRRFAHSIEIELGSRRRCCSCTLHAKAIGLSLQTLAYRDAELRCSLNRRGRLCVRGGGIRLPRTLAALLARRLLGKADNWRET
jgi:hypothetical protein